MIERRNPGWGRGQGWSLDLGDVRTPGADPSDSTYPLMWISDVARMDDGRVVVGNSGTRHLLIFDADGEFLSAGQPSPL